jgi:hypothetical protein
MLALPLHVRTNLAFGLVAVSWGGSYVASKIGLAEAGPFSFAQGSVYLLTVPLISVIFGVLLVVRGSL